ISDNGQPEIFIDRNGNEINEQLIILWAYNGGIDTNILYNSFGYIFEINKDNNQFYKDILSAIFNLHIDGPTVKNIKSICAAFLGVKPVRYNNEEVIEVFTDNYFKYVVTDKSTYQFELHHTILPKVVPGAVF